MGFDILELACETPDLIDVPAVKRVLEEHGLGGHCLRRLGPGPEHCQRATPPSWPTSKNYIRWLIDAAAELGSPMVCGPMYSGVGKAHLDDAARAKAEWERSVDGHPGNGQDMPPTRASGWRWNRSTALRPT